MLNDKIVKICEQKFTYLNYSNITKNNIESGKQALKNVKDHLYQEEHFLIMYKNRLEKIRSAK